MKRWHYIVIAAVGLAGFAYLYLHPGGLGLGSTWHTAGASGGSGSDAGGAVGRPARMAWQTVDRPEDGFKMEMPSDPKDLQVPAYNEGGSSEPVKMIFANPDGDTTFAISWEDNPPVARVNDRAAGRTLDMARDGMLARTQTSLVRETRVAPAGGVVARDIAAHNAEGGILDARLMYTGDRLYILMALFPSSNARREQDVIRFFNSFSPTRSRSIPETMPAASPTG